ncbi:hypothetical protein GIB67_034691 [Kingdonia uniflora]|uniref:Uncharacterized protein n=1 Tax=Kingdonia uniflora TaxID=39325 RepID=A0A7J7P072_9MAGN|nr:hypothetical protein GIB67_034691 [Kingdonia uniflora]
MCNRAHLRGESERKLLQVQVCESKACYENVLSEYQQVKCEIECYRYLTTSQVKEEEYVLMQKEMERYKMLLEESVVEQLILKEEALEIGNGLREELRNVSDVLEKATYELAEKTSEETECAVQLQNWKHIAESSKTTLVKEEEYVFMQKELERYKMMLKESDVEQLILKEEALEIENGLREELRNVSDALEKTTHELAEKRNRVCCSTAKLEAHCRILEKIPC